MICDSVAEDKWSPRASFGVRPPGFDTFMRLTLRACGTSKALVGDLGSFLRAVATRKTRRMEGGTTVLRSGHRVARAAIADDADGLAAAPQTPARSAPRPSPPVARSPRETCSGVLCLRGRAQPWGRPRARRQRRGVASHTPRCVRGRASACAAERRAARGATPDMNGRVYDPTLGRFLTADPYVQAPFWSQGLNRYAYVFNSPLNYTDPSGFSAIDDYFQGLNDAPPEQAIPGYIGTALVAGLAAYTAYEAVSATISTSSSNAAATSMAESGGADAPAAGAPAAAYVAAERFSRAMGPTSRTVPGKPPTRSLTKPTGGGPQSGTVQNRLGGATALPRYAGGANGATGGGAEGTGGGSPTPFSPGPLLWNAGPNRYVLSDLAKARLGPIFSQVGYDVNLTRVRFGLTPKARAFAYGNTVTINPSYWNQADLSDGDRLAMLAHEIGHSVQYQKSGKGYVLRRSFVEGITYSHDDLYGSMPDELLRNPIKDIDVVSEKYPLEALAERFAWAIRVPSLP